MKIIIQTPDFKAKKSVEKFVDKQVRKLENLYSRILESRVLLKIENSDKPDTKICDLQVVIPGNDLFASKRAATFEEAAVKAVTAVKRQLEKLKD